MYQLDRYPQYNLQLLVGFTRNMNVIYNQSRPTNFRHIYTPLMSLAFFFFLARKEGYDLGLVQQREGYDLGLVQQKLKLDDLVLSGFYQC